MMISAICCAMWRARPSYLLYPGQRYPRLLQNRGGPTSSQLSILPSAISHLRRDPRPSDARLQQGAGSRSCGKDTPDLADIDPVRVGQVVSNLLNNAVKFTEQGAISIQASYHDQQLLIAVTDTARHRQKEKLSRLFAKVEQVESDISRFGGTGLGLAIVISW